MVNVKNKINLKVITILLVALEILEIGFGIYYYFKLTNRPTYNQELTTYLVDNCHDTGPLESDLEKYELFISGEYHATQKNHDVQKNIIKNLCEKTDLKYIIMENTMANALIINDYIQTGDKSKLDMTFSNAKGTYMNNQEEYKFCQWLYEFNQSLPENKKLTYLGWDIEHQYETTIYYLKNLIQGRNIPELARNFIENFKSENAKDNIENILSSLEEICKDIDNYPSNYNLEKDFWTFKYLVENLLNIFKCENVKDDNKSWNELWAKTREDAVISNFYKIYNHYNNDHKVKFYGEWGLYHCFLNNDNNITLANYLNNNEDSPFKNKVCTMANVYFDSLGMDKNGDSYEVIDMNLSNNKKELDSLKIFALDNKIKFVKLDNVDSPFSKEMYCFQNELKNGVTTDCFKYLILIKSSKPCTKFN